MAKLNLDWLTEKHIDFEYKRYVLLAYLQDVSSEFKEVKLYPALSELVMHYRNLKQLKESKRQFNGQFEQRIKGFDWNNFCLLYEQINNDDALMQELEQIVDFSIPRFENCLKEGKKIYDFIEQHLTMSAVGIQPLLKMEGYLMLREKSSSDTLVYNYRVSLIEQPEERYRSLQTAYLGTYSKSISTTYESIKRELIVTHNTMPNPATWVIESSLSLNHQQTFLPVARRLLLQQISK